MPIEPLPKPYSLTDVLNRFVDPMTGKVYWRDPSGVLRPRVLTDADGRVVAQEQVGGFFPRSGA